MKTERAPISFLIPTKNEEKNLPYALKSVVNWAQDVWVLDSGSTDGTQAAAESFGAKFVHHDWEGYARQKNWGLDNLPFVTPWVFILDADEVVTPELRAELIRFATEDKCAENGFYVNRFFIFLGQRIHHCGYYPSWCLRFFRRGKARYEERDVHEHMTVDGKIGYLQHDMEHYDRRGMEHYIAKHNHYSTLEARELHKVEQHISTGTMGFSFWGGHIERRRWIKHKIWPKLPGKWIVRWIYQYFLRQGFRDGIVGFHFCLFLASYEHQITLKLKELRTLDAAPNAALPSPPSGEAQEKIG